jgi:CubicO group peptidase (beta-lactamase class C family)
LCSVLFRFRDGTCGKLSSRTFLHLGYTGTQICADPVNEVYTLLLTNRVYPTGENIKIQDFRVEWNDAIVELQGIN